MIGLMSRMSSSFDRLVFAEKAPPISGTHSVLKTIRIEDAQVKRHLKFGVTMVEQHEDGPLLHMQERPVLVDACSVGGAEVRVRPPGRDASPAGSEPEPVPLRHPECPPGGTAPRGWRVARRWRPSPQPKPRPPPPGRSFPRR